MNIEMALPLIKKSKFCMLRLIKIQIKKINRIGHIKIQGMEENFTKVSYFSNRETSKPDTTAEEREEAKQLRKFSNASEETATKSSSREKFLEKFPLAQIDEDCKQKYVLLEVTLPNEEKLHLVRGKYTASYHKDAAKKTVYLLRNCSLIKSFNILGGGRIRHSSENKRIDIYGYSYGFPWENDEYLHHLSAKAVQDSNLFTDCKICPDNTPGLY
eukprot:maker-scaffold_13-snap-gene-0.46-mRNA-1 protein AED:0.00 eAED:0.00 QI:58/1/1/1/1/1/2/506/214